MLITREHRFWIVTRPTPRSLRSDVCFQTDFAGLVLQFKGGLDPADVVGVSTEEGEAEALAERLLRERRTAVGEGAGLDARLRELLWDAITEPRLRDRAKALLDELIAAPMPPGGGSGSEGQARSWAKPKSSIGGRRTARRGRRP